MPPSDTLEVALSHIIGNTVIISCEESFHIVEDRRHFEAREEILTLQQTVQVCPPHQRTQNTSPRPVTGIAPPRNLSTTSSRVIALLATGDLCWSDKSQNHHHVIDSFEHHARLDSGSFMQVLSHAVSKRLINAPSKVNPQFQSHVPCLSRIDPRITTNLSVLIAVGREEMVQRLAYTFKQLPCTISSQDEQITNFVLNSTHHVFRHPSRLFASFLEYKPLSPLLSVAAFQLEDKRLGCPTTYENPKSSPVRPEIVQPVVDWWLTQTKEKLLYDLCVALDRLPDLRRQIRKIDSEEGVSILVGPIAANLHASNIFNCVIIVAIHSLASYTALDNPERLTECFASPSTRLAHAILQKLSKYSMQSTETAQILDPLFEHLRAIGRQVPSEDQHLYPDAVNDLAAISSQYTVARAMRYFCHAFEDLWDGRVMIAADGQVGRALVTLERLLRTLPTWFPSFVDAPTREPLQDLHEVLPRLTALDPFAMADAHLQTLSTHAVSLLLLVPHLAPKSFQARCLRALCFQRMRLASQNAHMHHRLVSYGMDWRSDGGNNNLRLPTMNTLRSHPSPQWSHGIRSDVSLYLSLQVRRDKLLTDAFDQLWHVYNRQVVRPLKVRIDNLGEEGMDAGGVAQEFFRLALREVFDPAYGMFLIDEQSHQAWFDPKTLEANHKFELLGLLMALALHNGFTLPISFPIVFYKKLLSEPFSYCLNDIRDGWPSLYKGLRYLASADDAEVEAISASYVFSFSTFGGLVIDIDMSDAGYNEVDTSPAVTSKNRQSYIQEYISWLLDKSIAPQFEAFAQGFYACVPRNILAVASADTLQNLMEGDSVLDIEELKARTEYEGFHSKQQLILDFWDILRQYDNNRKKHFLEFVTACDRLPMNGVKSLGFLIQRNGPDSSRLPTSSTCFARLLLPEYSSKEKLRQKLEIALDNAEGFGNR